VKAVILVGGLGTRLAEEATVRPKRTTNSSIPAGEVDAVEAIMNGGRLRRVLDCLDDEDFCLTYGDGLADGVERYLPGDATVRGDAPWA